MENLVRRKLTKGTWKRRARLQGITSGLADGKVSKRSKDNFVLKNCDERISKISRGDHMVEHNTINSYVFWLRLRVSVGKHYEYLMQEMSKA